MKNTDIICTCPLCLELIRHGIRQAFELERRPLGIFTVRIIAGLGWVPWIVYSHLFHAMVESGELVKFVPDSTNEPTRYLLSRHLPDPRTLAARERSPRHEQQR